MKMGNERPVWYVRTYNMSGWLLLSSPLLLRKKRLTPGIGCYAGPQLVVVQCGKKRKEANSEWLTVAAMSERSPGLWLDTGPNEDGVIAVWLPMRL